MIKSVTVTNHLGEKLTLELGNPDLSGFSVKEIKGLGPSKASINTKTLANTDGAIYNSSRMAYRNIVMKLGFLGSPTVEDSRQKTYKYFPIKRRVSLQFETDNRSVSIDGYVESNEPDIFSKESGCQISIICPDPYFRSTQHMYTVFAGVDPLFEFEFENEGLDPMLRTGLISYDQYKTIKYEGDIESGLIMSIHALGRVENLTIFNIDTRGIMSINTSIIETLTGSGLIAGDTITICTMQGYKSVTLLREGVTYNIMNAINKNAEWFKLSKGDNTFAYTAEYGATDIQFDTTSYILYEGI